MMKNCFVLWIPEVFASFFLLRLNFHSKFSDRRLLKLRSAECPRIGNHKRPRIFREISPYFKYRDSANTGGIVLEGWRPWRWEISEVLLDGRISNSRKPCARKSN